VFCRLGAAELFIRCFTTCPNMQREALGNGDCHWRALVAEANEAYLGEGGHRPPTIEEAIVHSRAAFSGSIA
jgi:hypothetical protein